MLNRGFSLIEVLFLSIIFLIILFPIAHLQTQILTLTNEGRQKLLEFIEFRTWDYKKINKKICLEKVINDISLIACRNDEKRIFFFK